MRPASGILSERGGRPPVSIFDGLVRHVDELAAPLYSFPGSAATEQNPRTSSTIL